jgi:enoyl-CoA hydratase/carnithine racemase
MLRLKKLATHLNPCDTLKMSTTAGSIGTGAKIEETCGSGLVCFFHHPTSRLGEILLNRPQKMNAVTKVMFSELSSKLKEWAERDDVQWIMWRGEAPVGKTRAFCAGGELSEVVSPEGIEKFIGPEYQLDYYIANYRKPQIAVWDGIVMGAGYGLTGHSSIRIATENTQFAMPEARFGLIADIGCSFLLTTSLLDRKEPGMAQLGKYLSITADRLRGGQETVWTGIATHSISSSKLTDLYDALCVATAEFFSNSSFSASFTSSDCQGLLQLLHHVVDDASKSQREISVSEFGQKREDRSESRIQSLLPHIQAIFGLETIADVYKELKRLEGEYERKGEEGNDEKREWINFCLNAFHFDCCPTSIAANFKMMDLAAIKDFTYAKSLVNDYRAAVRISLRSDIQMGAKAILLKSGPPKWSPSHINQVDLSYIDSLFSSLDEFPTENVKQDLELTS